MDAFHVVKLGTQVLDEVRRRVQQAQLHRRGHKNDPLYKVRGLLRHGLEHLTERQHRKLTILLQLGDPDGEVELAGSCYQQLRTIHSGTVSVRERRALAEKLIGTFPSCPVPEIARLGRTLRAWRAQVLAYFHTDGLSNGGTEAINVLIEKAPQASPRLPQLRQLPAADAPRGQRHQDPTSQADRAVTTLRSEEPDVSCVGDLVHVPRIDVELRVVRAQQLRAGADGGRSEARAPPNRSSTHSPDFSNELPAQDTR